MFKDYRSFLRSALEEKKSSEKSVSLRAFSRRAGISHSYLSRVLKGERGLTAAALGKITHLLELTPEDESLLLRQITVDQIDGDPNWRKVTLQNSIDSASKRFHEITADDFQAVSEWYYFAILSLAKTKGFKATPSWVAKRLGIEHEIAVVALQRLFRLGWLIKKGSMVTVAEDSDIFVRSDIPSSAIRKNHRQNLQLAQNALDKVPVNRREYINSPIPMNRSDIEKAKKRLNAFVDRFMRDFEKTGADDVFQLSLQFFQLTKNLE